MIKLFALFTDVQGGPWINSDLSIFFLVFLTLDIGWDLISSFWFGLKLSNLVGMWHIQCAEKLLLFLSRQHSCFVQQAAALSQGRQTRTGWHNTLGIECGQRCLFRCLTHPCICICICIWCYPPSYWPPACFPGTPGALSARPTSWTSSFLGTTSGSPENEVCKKRGLQKGQQDASQIWPVKPLLENFWGI